MPRKSKRTLPKDKTLEKITQLEKEKQNVLELKEFINSKTWQHNVQPMINKMITDTIGGVAKDGMWSPGIVGQEKGYNTEYLLGYRMGLIDLNNRLREQINMSKKIDEQIKDIKLGKKQIQTTGWAYAPMETT